MSEALQRFSVPTNEEVSVEPTPEEMTDPQTPTPQPSPRVDLPAQPDSHPLPNDDDERDFDRVDKMAYNWALTLFSISVALLLTDPQPVHHPERIVLCAAGTALACLSLIAALGLIYYSVFSHPGAQLAKVQKTAMGISALTLVLAALSRLALFLPFLLFLAVMASVILLACLLRLSIYLGHKIKAA